MADLKRLHEAADDLMRWHWQSTGIIAFIRKLFKKEQPSCNLAFWGSKEECGTVLCAMGYLALQPKYNAMGLTSSTYSYAPVYGHSTSWSAIAAFFDITIREAEKLFDSYAYSDKATARDVAKRIRSTYPKE